MLTCTERAAKHICLQLAKHENAIGIRIGVQASGCSGLAYALKFCEALGADDQVFEEYGVKIFVESKDLVFLTGTEIDYARKGLNEGFQFANPNEIARCGCGESFIVG